MYHAKQLSSVSALNVDWVSALLISSLMAWLMAAPLSLPLPPPQRTERPRDGVTQPGIVLGTGTGALLGGDLTDPENNGIETPTTTGTNFNWVTISASSEEFFEGGEGAFNVFDNKVGSRNNKWCCAGPEQWIAVEFAQPYVLTHFTITSGNDSNGRDPDIWYIEGSNDGSTWTPIFTYAKNGTSPFTARNQVILYNGAGADFATPVPYSWFRYRVTSVISGSMHQINELEFFGDPVTDLAVSKQATAATAIPGTAVTYTISYTNAAATATDNITLSDIVPAELTAVAFTSKPTLAAPTSSGQTYTWNLGTLASAATGVITVTGTVDPSAAGGSTITNTVAITTTSAVDIQSANNTASAAVTLSDTERCGLTTGTYTLNETTRPIEIAINTLGTIDCLQSAYTASLHPNATGAFLAGYWTIEAIDNGGVAAAGYNVTLTADQPNAILPLLCRYTPGSGNAGWDCDDGSQTSSTATTVTRQNITHLSDWAVANNVGPTAVTLSAAAAKSSSHLLVIAAFTILGTATAITRPWRKDVP